MTHSHLLVGAAALIAAATAVVVQSPRSRGESGGAPRGAPSGERAPDRRAVRSLGPLKVGDRVGDGWTVEGIEVDGVGASVAISSEHARTKLGLLAPSESDHGIVPMPDLYVTYTGDGTPAVAALIRAVADRLRAAAEGQPLHARVLAWAADAPPP